MATPRTVVTWSRESYACADYVEVDSVDALRRAVAAAKQVRCIGSHHSILDRIVPPPGGTLIDIRGLSRFELPATPPAGPDGVSTVTAEAGVRLDVLSDALAARGWAFSTMPAQGTVTVAGAISLGSHNTANHSPAVLADEVEGIEAVDATGELVTFGVDDLPAARVGLGALGAVHRAFCDALAPFSPRAHRAKGALGHVRSEFPAESFARWEAVRARMDPHRKFLAPGLAAHLPG